MSTLPAEPAVRSAAQPSFRGRTALMTGSTTGIGQMLAEALAAGSNVAPAGPVEAGESTSLLPCQNCEAEPSCAH